MNAVTTDEHFPSEAFEDFDVTNLTTDDELDDVHGCAMDAVAEANLTGIDIHGKRYTTVAKRVEIFRRHFGVYGRLRITEKTENDQGRIAMTAVVELKTEAGWDEVAQGHAEEVRGSSNITKTSAVEVCETSAYGRALANFGLHGGEFATADEVLHAKSQQGGTFKDNSGRPDTSEVDQKAAERYAENLRSFLANADLKAIYETQDELKGKPELYTAIWDKLSSKQRTDLRKIISERPKT